MLLLVKTNHQIINWTCTRLAVLGEIYHREWVAIRDLYHALYHVYIFRICNRFYPQLCEHSVVFDYQKFDYPNTEASLR